MFSPHSRNRVPLFCLHDLSREVDLLSRKNSRRGTETWRGEPEHSHGSIALECKGRDGNAHRQHTGGLLAQRFAMSFPAERRLWNHNIQLGRKTSHKHPQPHVMTCNFCTTQAQHGKALAPVPEFLLTKPGLHCTEAHVLTRTTFTHAPQGFRRRDVHNLRVASFCATLQRSTLTQAQRRI